MRPPAVLAPLLVVLLALGLSGCGGGSAESAAARLAPATTAPAPDDASAALDGVAAQSGFAMGADVASFCTAMMDADDAVDGARPGSARDWKQVVAALDRIYEVGVPEDFPDPALAELAVLDRLVRESDSVRRLLAAAKRERAGTDAIEAYLADACTG